MLIVEHAHLHHVGQHLLLLVVHVLRHGSSSVHWVLKSVLAHHHLHEHGLVLLRELHLVVRYHLLLPLLHVHVVHAAEVGSWWHLHVVLAHLLAHSTAAASVHALVHVATVSVLHASVETSTSTSIHVHTVGVMNKSTLVTILAIVV